MISVIIPLYNKGPHINRAISSVLAQTKHPKEIIVVNDGSTDGGEEIVRQLADPRIKLMSQDNAGVSAARNRGIREATGNLIAFLDADDAWRPEFLETVWELHRRYPDAGAYVAAYEVCTAENRRVPAPKALPEGNERGLIKDFMAIAPEFALTICAALIPKAILEEVGGFPTHGVYGKDVDVELCEDADLFVKIALRYPIAYSSEIMATYHQDDVNRACLVKRRTGEPALSRTIRQALQAGLAPPEQLRDLQEYAALHQLAAVNDLLMAGQKTKALELLNMARHTHKYLRCWFKLRLMAMLPQRLALYSLRLWEKLSKKLG